MKRLPWFVLVVVAVVMVTISSFSQDPAPVGNAPEKPAESLTTDPAPGQQGQARDLRRDRLGAQALVRLPGPVPTGPNGQTRPVLFLSRRSRDGRAFVHLVDENAVSETVFGTSGPGEHTSFQLRIKPTPSRVPSRGVAEAAARSNLASGLV